MTYSRQTYFVTWSMPLDAADPVHAAVQALDMMRDPASIATCFRVDQGGQTWHLDVEDRTHPIWLRGDPLPTDDPHGQ